MNDINNVITENSKKGRSDAGNNNKGMKQLYRLLSNNKMFNHSIHLKFKQMKNKQVKNKKGTDQSKGREGREDKKIDLPKHNYPKPSEKDEQVKNQPEFIEPRDAKKHP